MESAEYLVVIEVLSRPRGRDRERLYRALRGFDRLSVDVAIASLEQAGVIVASARSVRAAPALRRLELLNLIGV